MTLQHQTITIVTDTAGAFTSTRGGSAFGKLVSIRYYPGNIDTGATVTVTCEGTMSTALLTKANAGTSNVEFYPRALQNGVADGAALTGTAGGDRTAPVCAGYFKVVVASGGAVHTGSVEIFYEN